jgi:CsoR family transcriptional regulator, copper-sensing transcriptional repressor
MQPEYKKKLIHHLHRIKGQVEGIEKMVEAHKYCVNIMTQSLAVEKSIQRFNADLLENHLTEHIPHQFKHGNHSKAVKELIKVFNLKNK